MRVLIVEDDSAQRETIRSLISREGFGVVTCSTLREALRLLNRETFAICVLDLRLELECGVDLLRELDDGVVGRTQFIILTAYGSFGLARDALNLGAFALVEKMSDPSELLSQIHRAAAVHLRRSLTEAKAEIEFQVRLLDCVQQAVIATDLSGQVIYWNQFAESMYGWSAREAKGKSIFDLVVGVEQRAEGEEIMRRLRTGKSWQGEFLVRHCDGKPFPAEVVNSPIFDANDELIGIIGVSSDISQRKTAEFELRHAKEFSELIINSSIDGILAFDRECRYTLWNPGMERISELAQEECLGKCAFDVFPFLKESGEDQYFYTALQGKNVVANDRPYVNSKGRSGWFEGYYSPLRDATGGVQGGLAVIRDVTRRVQAEETRQEAIEALRRSERNLAEAQRIGQIGSWEWDLVTKATTWSDELVRLAGVDPRHFNPSLASFLGLVVPEDRQMIQDAVQATLERDELFDVEYRITRHDGIRYHICTAKLTRDPLGKPLRLLGTVQDVTDRRALEANLRRTERLASLGTLAAGIAHEINNPMSAAWMAAETAKAIKDRPDAAEMLEECLDAVVNSVRRCQVIIENVQRFSRQELSEKATRDVNKIVERAVETTSFYVQSRGRSLEVDLAEGLPHTTINAAEIEQVLVNLIRNAVEADANSILVTTEGGDDGVRVSIRDDGRGIEEAEVQHVFDPFFTCSAGGRTGLGLAISHGIIRDHQGSIEIESRVGIGTTFTITLPLPDQKK